LGVGEFDERRRIDDLAVVAFDGHAILEPRSCRRLRPTLPVFFVDGDLLDDHVQVDERDRGKAPQRAAAHGLLTDAPQVRFAAHRPPSLVGAGGAA